MANLTYEDHSIGNDNASIRPSYFGSALWISIYCVIICAAIIGNLITICAIFASRQLCSTISNQFIFSLGISDLLVGLSIPYHMCFYMIDDFGENKNTCLVRFVLITFACSSSILNLLLIATDRYAAIVHPLKYNRYMTREISLFTIAMGWTLTLIIATVPIYWNTWTSDDCDVKIVPAKYFNFVLMPLFILIWALMLMVYMKIWREAYKHARRIRNTTSIFNSNCINDTKSIQVVMLTLGSFSICWLPYFIVTTYFRISGNSSKFSLLYEIAFTMAVGNSGVNPMIYAWKNSNFREAFRCLLTCQSPNKHNKNNSYITNHIPSKKSSMSNNNSSDGGIKQISSNRMPRVVPHNNNRKNTWNEQQNNGNILIEAEERRAEGHENLAHDIDIELNNHQEYDENECSVSTDVTNVNI